MNNLYTQDPNQYIRNLSRLRKSIHQNINIHQQNHIINPYMDKLIVQKLAKYKKHLLTDKKIKLSKQLQSSQLQQKNSHLQQIINNKIKTSQEIRQNNIKNIIQHKKMERIMKQTINFTKKQQIRKNNLQKSLQIIQRIQNKQKSINDFTGQTKLIQEKIKSVQKHTHSLSPSKILSLPKLYHSVQLSKKTNDNLPYITSEILKRSKSQNKSSQFGLFKKLVQDTKRKNIINGSQSERKLKILRSYDLENQKEALRKLIEQNEKKGFCEYMQRQSLSYKVVPKSHHKDIRKAIEDFLHNSRHI